MRTNNNAARKLRPVPPPPPDLAPRERRHSALAGFIVCAFAGGIFGYAAGMLTGLTLWHH